MTPRTGRATKQEEIEKYLQSLDLAPEVIAAIRAADPRVQVIPPGDPGSFTEMRERAGRELWDYFQNATGIAKAQAYRAIDEAARREQAESGAEIEPEPLIADIVGGTVNLSPIRKRQILLAEKEKMRQENEAIDRVLAEMDAAPGAVA